MPVSPFILTILQDLRLLDQRKRSIQRSYHGRHLARMVSGDQTLSSLLLRSERAVRDYHTLCQRIRTIDLQLRRIQEHFNNQAKARGLSVEGAIIFRRFARLARLRRMDPRFIHVADMSFVKP
jgi:uncharacterized membrane protein YccC